MKVIRFTLLGTLFCLGSFLFGIEELPEVFSIYEQALNHPNDCQEIEMPRFYLLIKTCRHQKNYFLAIKLLEEREELTPELELELAINYYLIGNFPEAKTVLLEIEKNTSIDPSIATLASFYLARIFLVENDYSSATLKLNALQSTLSKTDLLSFELFYLQGELAFQCQNYLQAIHYFKLALPQRHHKKAEWYPETLYFLGWSHLKAANNFLFTSEQQKEHLQEAENYFDALMKIQPDERIYLALAHCKLFKTMPFKDDPLFAKLLQQKDPSKAAFAFIYQIKAYLKSPSEENLLIALYLLKNHLENPNIITENIEEPQELLYLYGATVHALITQYQRSNEPSAQVIEILQKALNEYPEGLYSDACLNLLGQHYLFQENLIDAESTYGSIINKYPSSSYTGEALYWIAYCGEKLKKDPLLIKIYRKQLFEKYPSSPFAPIAYFQYYTYRDYLQGDRTALKHLQAFSQLFPESPLQVTAYYLIGLDYKRERKGSSGKAIRKKNLAEAINAFMAAEQTFERLYSEKKIPDDQTKHYLMIRYRAILERALANQTIALESQSTKRQIYSQYTHEVLEQLNEELANLNHPFTAYLSEEMPLPKIQEESLYLLTKSYILLEDDKKAQKAIQTQLQKYSALNISKGYYLAQTYYEKGMLAMKQAQYSTAQAAFKAAEITQDNHLNVDQKLDLWIQQSACCKALNQLDSAMFILSKVINDPAISSLRIKAMYLRSEIYALQGRHELALKQLQATANKGGEWALKAKTKMEEEYGYQ